jgi:uncharacterized membrane protein YdbT with pleckstrin-like domain
MAFPESILIDDETIIRQFRPHWRMLAIPVLWFLAAVVAIGLVFEVIPPENGTVDLITTGVIVLAMFALVVNPLLKWWFTLYVLTSERLVTRTGIIARSGIEIPLENINNVIFTQSIIERILQSGDLLIESAGESGQSRFSDIPNPEEFQALLYRTREQQARRAAAEETTIADDASQDPMERLERAARLHEAGKLSDEEFEAMKRTILGDKK